MKDGVIHNVVFDPAEVEVVITADPDITIPAGTRVQDSSGTTWSEVDRSASNGSETIIRLASPDGDDAGITLDKVKSVSKAIAPIDVEWQSFTGVDLGKAPGGYVTVGMLNGEMVSFTYHEAVGKRGRKRRHHQARQARRRARGWA